MLYLTGFSQRSIYGQSYRVKDDITMEDLRTRAAGVSERETRRRSAISSARNRVTVFDGMASFVDNDTVVITAADGRRQVVDAERIVIATGSRPVRPAGDRVRRGVRSSTPTASSTSTRSRSRSSSSAPA